MCFSGPISRKRTNESFRKKSQKSYHANNTILEEINGVPIDYPHVTLLGVMKKLLKLWFSTIFTKPKF
jgi:hypothetical protein